MAQPDRTSPIPLYHQISDALRREIESGALPAGSALEPIREAAQRLGVNLHTVRHAYAELARHGLVESRRARGTRVLPFPRTSPAEPAFEGEVRATCARLGVTPHELHRRLGRWLAEEAAADPAVYLVECSPAQCQDLAGQLAERWAVDARPWPLERGAPPDDGTVIATFFHYNEIRTQWPERLHTVRFLTISPDPSLPRRLDRARSTRAKRTSVIVCELDAPTLDAVAADLSVILPDERYRIVPRHVAEPRALLERRSGPPVLFSPRLWSQLSDVERAHPRAVHLRYLFDRAELEELGPRLGLRGTP